MQTVDLIDALRRPEAYPGSQPGPVEILQTHISVVALVGSRAYKVKKAVDLGFLDFTTLEKRRHFCEEEVRLNRRLAPHVYLGVVPIVEDDGQLVVDGAGVAVEYAVEMRRLPADRMLRECLRRGEVTADTVEELARRVAAFHASAASGPEIDRFGGWEVVARNARENLEQSSEHVGVCLTMPVFERLAKRLERELARLRALMDARARGHLPRDTHGDLHLEHVYLFPDREPPGDLVAIDCVEFNERFRYADPVADMAFLAMDLDFHGRRDLSSAFADEYFRVADDAAGRELLPFYVAYRAAVRAKVEGMVAGEEEVPEDDRRKAIRRARAHWLLALSELEPAERRPALVLVGGLPGTGKTTLAEGLAGRLDFDTISSDRVRKELAGLTPETPAGAAFGEGIYTSEWNDRTYEACLERAGRLLSLGRRVIVDASFREAARRRVFLEAGLAHGVRTLFLECTAPEEAVRQRLADRRGGASDADQAVYRAAASVWEADESRDPRRIHRLVDTGGGREEALRTASRHLEALGLARAGSARR